jgi:hypothetical protein
MNSMFDEMITSAFNVFMMVCVYAMTNAVVDISNSLRSIKSCTDDLRSIKASIAGMNHYLFVLNRELRIYNSISEELSAEKTSVPTADSF